MAITNEPRIILRYDREPARDGFAATFARDFRISAFCDDCSAMASLNADSDRPAALFVLSENPGSQVESPLLIDARDRHPGLMKIMVGDAIPLNLLVTLLEKRLVDRCFEQPLNPELIRSQVLAAALVNRAPEPTLPETADRRSEQPAVLIVDDESAATKYLARQLARLQDDFRILCADNADQALDCIRREPGPIAVIMTDQRMPGMQGKELLDELKQTHPETVRILTSAYGEVDVALEAVNEGEIFRYQKKPWRAQEMLPLFREAIARHQALRAARHHARSDLDHQFSELLFQRRSRLHHILPDPIRAMIGDETLTDFLEALATIRTLPANNSHLRASRETALENELIQDFGALVLQQLSGLQSEPPTPVPPSEDAIRSGLRTAATENEASPVEPAPLALMCRALTTLLNASGLGQHNLNLGRTSDGNDELVIAPESPLRVYTHLLAPLTRISRPLLEQQAALLMLFVSVRRLGGRLTLVGGQQSCELALRFPITRGWDVPC